MGLSKLSEGHAFTGIRRAPFTSHHRVPKAGAGIPLRSAVRWQLSFLSAPAPPVTAPASAATTNRERKNRSLKVYLPIAVPATVKMLEPTQVQPNERVCGLGDGGILIAQVSGVRACHVIGNWVGKEFESQWKRPDVPLRPCPLGAT